MLTHAENSAEIFGRNFRKFSWFDLAWDLFFFKGNSFLLHNKVERCVTELPVCALLTFHMKKIPGSLLFAL